MRRCTRREFAAGISGAMGAAVVAGRSIAAPFVPARDPQVVAFAPAGTTVATGCSGLTDGAFPPRPHPNVRKCGVVAVWDVRTRKRLFRWDTFGDLTKLAFSPNGTLLAAARLYQTDDGIPLPEVRVWDVAAGRVAKVLDRCHNFDFSPDGRDVTVLSRSKCVVYSARDWTKQRQIEPLGRAVSVAFSADGLSLIGILRADGQYHLRMCDAGSGQIMAESLRLPQPFYCVATSVDGSLLATGHDRGNAILWDAATLDVRSRLSSGEPGLAHPFFSPDAQLLAAGCQQRGDVVIWRLSDRQELARYTFEKGGLRTYFQRPAEEGFRPEKDPTRFCFSPDGEAFLVGAYGGILRATADGRELARFGD